MTNLSQFVTQQCLDGELNPLSVDCKSDLPSVYHHVTLVFLIAEHVVFVNGQVNSKLGEMNTEGGHMQVCLQRSTLKKKLYLFPYR